MNVFTINNDNFGIDSQESTAELRDDGSDLLLLTLDVIGGRKEFRKLSSDESSRWFWALHPPRLYAYDIPLAKSAWQRGSSITVKDEQDLEMAIYMMEHNEVFDLVIAQEQKDRLRISGQTTILGKVYPFSVSITVPSAAA